MTRDDELVTELAVRMHQADHDELPPAPPATATEDAPVPPRVDFDTYVAAHEASQWDDDPPLARRRRA